MKFYSVVLVAILGIAHASDNSVNCPQRVHNVPNFEETMRQDFVDMHDIYRSTFAQSNQASKMRKLVYDCKVEQSAYISAVQSRETKPSTNSKNLRYDEIQRFGGSLKKEVSAVQILLAILSIAHADGGDLTCSQNTGDMSYDMRLKFLELHNGFRSRLALGHVSIVNVESYNISSYAHRASKMKILEYDCQLEDSAFESAQKCSNNASSSYENVYVIKDTEDHEIDEALEAINSRSSEALDIIQTEEGIPYLSNSSISNFANMARDTHSKVGCAVFSCNSGKTTTHVVCQYASEENEEGKPKPIYTIGVQCTGCLPKFCHPDIGLCENEPYLYR
ncbi:hypothetical protein Aduo_014518 [Ancylostoma duodenale]